MRILDSRASRMGPVKALRSVHADYIGGYNSNYRKWYFGSQMDLEDHMASIDPNFYQLSFKERNKQLASLKYSLKESQMNWAETTNSFLPEDCIIQLAIYLLIWGEANNLRFMPECLCFIFKACVDSFYSLDFTNEIQPLTDSFLDHAITPLYNFYRDQLYSYKDGNWIVKNKDHKSIIGYDDLNQSFWYRKSLERFELQDKRMFLELQPNERYLYLNQINWKKSVRKTYYETRSWFHVLLDFNRVWNIHLGIFWYYTCFNCPTLYTHRYLISANNQPSLVATLTLLSLAGPIVSCVNLISLTLEFIFVSRSFPGALPIFSRFLFVLFCIIVTTLPTVYFFFITGTFNTSLLTYAIALTQFITSLLVVSYFSVVPLSSITGNYYSEENRNFLPSLYFTNSIYTLKGKKALASLGLWGGVFVSKFTESYFFLTLSLRDPVRELSVIQINSCLGEEWFGPALCKLESKIILGLLFATNLILFFFGHIFMVYHMEYSIFRCKIILLWSFNLDTMEEYVF